tara:strand:- start:157 stop:381 length:225 start_codon:yes stop_codon:yes gene_type:complete
LTTDVGDKFLKQAAGQINSITELGEENIDSFPQDVDALGILRLDRMLRAPLCLDGIRSLIGELDGSEKPQPNRP